MKTPHKHAELIKAWADGHEIQAHTAYGWRDVVVTNPSWHDVMEYRIKPEPKPDVVLYFRCAQWWGHETVEAGDNTKATFDGETGQLKSAEVIL